MDTDMASAATGMKQAQAAGSVQVSLLKKALDAEKSVASLVEQLPDMVAQISGLGRNLDLTA